MTAFHAREADGNGLATATDAVTIAAVACAINAADIVVEANNARKRPVAQTRQTRTDTTDDADATSAAFVATFLLLSFTAVVVVVVIAVDA
jgi:ABC-type Fe3+ transport system permease subunit